MTGTPGTRRMDPLPVDMQHGRTDGVCLRRGRLGNHTTSPQRARDPWKSPPPCMPAARRWGQPIRSKQRCIHAALPPLTTRYRRPIAALRVNSPNRDDGVADGACSVNQVHASDQSFTNRRRALHRLQPRPMLSAHEVAPVADTNPICGRARNSVYRWTERRARCRPLPCSPAASVHASAAKQPPALVRSLTALGAAALLSISCTGACHANELFQKTCAGAPALLLRPMPRGFPASLISL